MMTPIEEKKDEKVCTTVNYIIILKKKNILIHIEVLRVQNNGK